MNKFTADGEKKKVFKKFLKMNTNKLYERTNV